MSIIPYKPIDSNDDAPVYSEYRCKRYPAKTSFFIEHQNFQANYAAGFVTAALVMGYFHLLDNQLSGFVRFYRLHGYKCSYCHHNGYGNGSHRNNTIWIGVLDAHENACKERYRVFR